MLSRGIYLTQDLQTDILESVEYRDVLNTLEHAERRGKEHQEVVGVAKSLASLGDVSKFSQPAQCLLTSVIVFLSGQGKC